MQDFLQTEITESAEVGCGSHFHLKRCTKLNLLSAVVGGIDGIFGIVQHLHTTAYCVEQLVCVGIHLAGKLNLSCELIGTHIKLLFCGDDGEQVQREGKEDYNHEDKDNRFDIGSFAAIVFQDFRNFH